MYLIVKQHLVQERSSQVLPLFYCFIGVENGLGRTV